MTEIRFSYPRMTDVAKWSFTSHLSSTSLLGL